MTLTELMQMLQACFPDATPGCISRGLDVVRGNAPKVTARDAEKAHEYVSCEVNSIRWIKQHPVLTLETLTYYLDGIFKK